MDPAITFYQALAGTSFTLLGLWFGIVQFAHGGWRIDPRQHRAGLHVALHFFLPGMASLASMLAAGVAGGFIWRSTFVVTGLIGLVEAVSFLRLRLEAVALPSRILRSLDPVLYAAMVVVACVPPGLHALTPLQLAGMATGGVFLVGLCFMWLAFAEPQDGGGNRTAQTPSADPVPVQPRPEPTQPHPRSTVALTPSSRTVDGGGRQPHLAAPRSPSGYSPRQPGQPGPTGEAEPELRCNGDRHN
jgi:hypothetical protein